MPKEIIIDNEFKNLIPPLSTDEHERLEKSILEEGCRDALILWGNTLVDGHNRYEICTRHEIPFETVQRYFASRDDAKLWMMQNQLARRNLGDMQRVAIVRKCEDAVRAKAKERQESTQFGGGGNISTTEGKARDELGAMAGVSGKTYEHAVTVLETAPAPVVDAAMRDDISINAAYQVTKMEPEQQEEIAERIERGEAPKEVIADVQKRPHVSFNSGNNEWYTPIDYIEAARDVMGSIDFDPASSEIANETVKAEEYYTAETNGLDKAWHGNVWMNPPYASDLIGKFIDKLIEELPNIDQAMVLVNNATETEWFNKLIPQASAVCFPRSRVKFYMPDGKTGAPLQGQAIIYFGTRYDKFINVFSQKGWCALPQ
jgi:ParB family chromosome partitioning protein